MREPRVRLDWMQVARGNAATLEHALNQCHSHAGPCRLNIALIPGLHPRNRFATSNTSRIRIGRFRTESPERQEDRAASQ